ncbi:MAG TPA: cytochrome c oxidase assembly protein [Terriglobia bacterium]|nr:cytochrome c oxidase assembly protein [Terriglobia bacterium]
MPSSTQAAVESWSLPILATSALVVVALIYLAGWFRLRGALPTAVPAWRLGAFLGGLFSLWIAVGSPLSMVDHELLTAHMIQHILLMTVAAPLVLLGAPALPFMHGLPQSFVRGALGSPSRWPALQGLGRILTHPAFCWLAAMSTLVAWHVPVVFELGLKSHLWHAVEHASFFATGLLFWWPVVQPWPGVAKWPRWSMPLYLFCATLPCDVLSAFLAFCDRVVYLPYLSEPRLFALSALQDQECAGALMWTCATFVYLIPAVIITIRILSPSGTRAAQQLPAALRADAGQRLSQEVPAVQ